MFFMLCSKVSFDSRRFLFVSGSNVRARDAEIKIKKLLVSVIINGYDVELMFPVAHRLIICTKSRVAKRIRHFDIYEKCGTIKCVIVVSVIIHM